MVTHSWLFAAGKSFFATLKRTWQQYQLLTLIRIVLKSGSHRDTLATPMGGHTSADDRKTA
jgi:hypothetical protein